MPRLAGTISGLPVLLILAGMLLLGCSASAADDHAGAIVVLPTTGVVDNVMAGYIEGGLDRAAQDGALAVIIELDTPGGNLDATQQIVSSLLDPPLPAIVWVGPPGAKAASAGTFITLAANLAYMAPGTNIGAATPVSGSGEDIPGDMGEKVKNDAIASITAIAEARGRPVEQAVAAVEKAASFPASEAVEVGLVDGIAETLEAVRDEADGEVVEVGGQEVTLALAGAPLVELDMNPFQSLLHLLSDPNIAFILFTVGFYGLLFELQNPNFVTGILGALAIILAFIGFGSLPLNLAGLLLIGLAVTLFVLEFTVTSHGLLTIGGLICFALGASALYTEPGSPTAPDVTVALPLIGVMTTMTALFMAVVVYVVVRSRREDRFVGFGAGGSSTVPPGTAGEVKSPLIPTGSVYAAGEEWTARTADGSTLTRGTEISVVGQDGLTLIVEPTTSIGTPT